MGTHAAALIAAASMLLSVPPAPVAAALPFPADTSDAAPYVVVVGTGRSVSTPALALAEARDRGLDRAAAELIRALRIVPTHTYASVLHGFSANLTAAQLRILQADPRVRAVVPDASFTGDATLIHTTTLPNPVTPNGIKRTYADDSPLVGINGNDSRADIDIAIIDSGYPVHPDIVVAGSYDCMSPVADAGRDRNGHSSHVSGIAGARDDDTGVVGMAPGARLWEVKVLNDLDDGTLSSILCGIDWVMAQREPGNPIDPLIEVASMSIAGAVPDIADGTCGETTHDPMHLAICAAVADGIVFVAAAGNFGRDASHYRPGSYSEVITVSGLADFDGRPGGYGRQGDICPWYSSDRDDTYYDESDYGPAVDLIAPAKCILSTYKKGLFAWETGTSMATPHVAGAAAQYLLEYPDAKPMQVRQALINAANFNWKTSTDPDGNADPLLDMRDFGPPPDIAIDAAAVTAHLGPRGVLDVPVDLIRSHGHVAPLTWSVDGLADHVTATIIPVGGGDVVVEFRASAAVDNGTMEARVSVTDGELTRRRTLSVPITRSAEVDFSAPDPASVTVTGADPNITVSWTETTGANGVPSERGFRRQHADAVQGGSCDGVEWANDGPLMTPHEADPNGSPATGWNASVNDLTVAGCYRWLAILTDDQGSPATWASGSVIVDLADPGRPDVTGSGDGVWQKAANEIVWVRAGTGSLELTARGRDADGGVVSHRFGALSDGTGWVHAKRTVQGDPARAILDWNSGADPTTLDVTSTDAVGHAGLARSVDIRIDGTAPSTPEWRHPRRGDTQYENEPPPITWSGGSDSGSGFAPLQLVQRFRGTIVTTGTCSGVTFFKDGSPQWMARGHRDGAMLPGKSCYRWEFTARDRVGNKGGKAVSGNVLLDWVGPKGDFQTPDEGTFTVRDSRDITVRFSVRDTGGSGRPTYEVERERAQPKNGGCEDRFWRQDGGTSTPNGVLNVLGLERGWCYRWRLVMVDRSLSMTTAISGAILITQSGGQASASVSTISASPAAFLKASIDRFALDLEANASPEDAVSWPFVARARQRQPPLAS